MQNYITCKLPVGGEAILGRRGKEASSSMNKEVFRVLEEERMRREAAKSPAKDMDRIMAAARRLQSFAVVDQRPIEEILYDEEGMPR